MNTRAKAQSSRAPPPASTAETRRGVNVAGPGVGLLEAGVVNPLPLRLAVPSQVLSPL